MRSEKRSTISFRPGMQKAPADGSLDNNELEVTG